MFQCTQSGTPRFPDFLLKEEPVKVSWVLWCVLIPAAQYSSRDFFSWWIEKSRTSRAAHAEGVISEEEHSLTQRGAIQYAFRPGTGVGRREEREKKDASFPALGAAGQECKSKFKPSECCARSREFGVPLSRSLQYVRELPNGMCGIPVIYLMYENWFLLSLLYCLGLKYFWFPTWCSNHQATAVLREPGSNGSSGQLPPRVRLRQVACTGRGKVVLRLTLLSLSGKGGPGAVCISPQAEPLSLMTEMNLSPWTWAKRLFFLSLPL